MTARGGTPPSPGPGSRRRVEVLALVAAAVAALVVLVVPMYRSVTQYADGRTATSTQGFLEVNGTWAIAVVLIPVVLAGVPLLLHGRAHGPGAIVATVMLCIFVFLSGFTIGLFFLPAAICAVIALALPAPSAGNSTRMDVPPGAR